MPDGLIEVTARAILEVGARVAVKYIFYPIGWVGLKFVTLGKYPQHSKPHNRDFVSTVGIATILACITFIYK